MLLDDITDYLSSGGIGTIGTNLFGGFMPDTPDVAVAVYESGGRPPDVAMGPSAGAVAMEWPSVQVVCRATAYDYAVARTKAHDAFKLLQGLPTRTINGTQYHWGMARQSPFLMGRDEAGRVLIACNYDIAKALSA